MAKFDKIAVLNKIGSTGRVPVFYHKDAEVAKKVVKACYDGGVRHIEKQIKYPLAAKDEQGRLLCGAAVGITANVLARVDALVKASVRCV